MTGTFRATSTGPADANSKFDFGYPPDAYARLIGRLENYNYDNDSRPVTIDYDRNEDSFLKKFSAILPWVLTVILISVFILTVIRSARKNK